jgi:hypothetical protein
LLPQHLQIPVHHPCTKQIHTACEHIGVTDWRFTKAQQHNAQSISFARRYAHSTTRIDQNPGPPPASKAVETQILG